MALKLIEMRNKHEAGPPLNQLIVDPEMVQPGLGRTRFRAPLYKKVSKRFKYSFYQQAIIYNFWNCHYGKWCNGKNYQSAKFICTIMQQNIINNEFNREYAPLPTIQQGAFIEFIIKGSNDLYLDLNNLRLHVLDKIINETARTSM